MTGGTLPALSWREIMIYAHQGLDAKPPYGVAPAPPVAAVAATAPAPAGKAANGVVEAAPRAIGLSARSTRIMLEIGEFAHTARRRMAASEGPTDGTVQANAGPTLMHAGAFAP
jgi:penicillin-binding protein 1A